MVRSHEGVVPLATDAGGDDARGGAGAVLSVGGEALGRELVLAVVEVEDVTRPVRAAFLGARGIMYETPSPTE